MNEKWTKPAGKDINEKTTMKSFPEILATKMLQFKSKRFYLDVKQNRNGKYITVSELSFSRRRNIIFLTLSTAAEFLDHLSTFIKKYIETPTQPENIPEDGKWESELMIEGFRRYYLDLKQNLNGHGCYLKVSQTTRIGDRSQIFIEADEEMVKFHDALAGLLEMHGNISKRQIPDGRQIRMFNRSFYFDVEKNSRQEISIHLSEVTKFYRSKVTIPETCWSSFHEIFTDYLKIVQEDDTPDRSELTAEKV